MDSHFFLAQSINLNLDLFKFRPEGASFSNQYVAAAIIGVLLLGAAVGVYFLLRRRREYSDLSMQREEARLRLLMSELNLGDTENELLITLAGDDHPSNLVPLIEFRSEFENALTAFRSENPSHPSIKRMSQLRQRLEFGFGNIRNPFTDTRMLAPGMKMRCRIRTPKRDIDFLTTMLGLNENNFIIRPPIAKGKPVEMARFNELHFRVSRENDAEYEFISRVSGQLPEGNRAVVMEHTKDISRMLFRNAERVETTIPVQLYVIRQEFTSDRAVAHLKAMDSQYVFEGEIIDLSIGGALVRSKNQETRLNDGDVVVFQLPASQIKDDLVSQVVGIFEGEGGNPHMHMQFLGLKELNRLKLSKYLEILRENTVTSSEYSEPTASGAS